MFFIDHNTYTNIHSNLSNSLHSKKLIFPRCTAHCFWDEANLLVKSATNFQIIAGKSTNNYGTMDRFSQMIDADGIIVPEK